MDPDSPVCIQYWGLILLHYLITGMTSLTISYTVFNSIVSTKRRCQPLPNYRHYLGPLVSRHDYRSNSSGQSRAKACRTRWVLHPLHP